MIRLIFIALSLSGCSTYHLHEKVVKLEQNQAVMATKLNEAFGKVNTRLTLLENPRPEKKEKAE